MIFLESIRKYVRLLLDIVVYLAAVVGLVGAFAPITGQTTLRGWLPSPLLRSYWYLIVLVAATIFAIPLFTRLAQPKLFREYGFVASRDILTREATRLRIGRNGSNVAVSRDYVFLQRPRRTAEFIEAEDNNVKSFGAKGLNYESADSEVEKFEQKGPNRYIVYWKPHHEILPYAVYHHNYEYKPPVDFVHGVTYLFSASTMLTGNRELEVSTYLPFAQVECFATRAHLKDAKELTEAVLFHPAHLIGIEEKYNKSRNKVRIAIPNPQLGLNYYIAWSHDASFRKIWREEARDELKALSLDMKRYFLPRYHALKRMLEDDKLNRRLRHE
jgi:hypothetical protein